VEGSAEVPDRANPADSAGPNAVSGRSPDPVIPRGRLYAALSLPIVVIVAVIVGGVIWSRQQPTGSTGPVAAPAVPSPGGSGRLCNGLMTALPADLSGAQRREVIGSPPGTAAWGEPAVILRCGLPTPAELSCSSALTQVWNPNRQPGVQWWQNSEGGHTTYLAVDRGVRVALTIPDGSGSAAIQQLSAVISGVLPARAVCSAGTLLPTDDR